MFREVFEERVVQNGSIMLNFIDRQAYRNLGLKGERQAPKTLSNPGVYIMGDGVNTYVGKSMDVAERFKGHEKKIRYAVVIQASYELIGFTSGMISFIEGILIKSLIEEGGFDLSNKILDIGLETNYEQSMGIDVLKSLNAILNALKSEHQNLFKQYSEILLPLETIGRINYTMYAEEQQKHSVLDDYILKNYVFKDTSLVINTEHKFLNAAKHLVKDVNYHLMEVEFMEKQTHGVKLTPYLIFIDAAKVEKTAYEALALTLMHGSDVQVINIMKDNKAPYVVDMSYSDDDHYNCVEILNYDLKNHCFLNKSEAQNKIEYVVTKHKDPYETCMYDFTYNEQSIYINSSVRF